MILDRFKRTLGRFFDEDPITIMPFIGYGSAEHFFISGRVLEDKGVSTLNPTSTRLDNLVYMFERMESDEISNARLRVQYHEFTEEITANKEGYFNLHFTPPSSMTDQLWHEVNLELLEPKTKDNRQVSVISKVMTPPSSAKFGVISDIDDTIVWTNVANKLRMVLSIFLNNAHTRLPFKGVAKFYQALQQGQSGQEGNPIFYVSGSPWNLYEPILEFLNIHQIPIGPIMLRDLALRTMRNRVRLFDHKVNNIESIIKTYPHLPFILIGDSGEKDPEIYREIVHKYPNRIRAIYIRNVNPDPARHRAIDSLIKELSGVKCQLILAHDSEFAATHAASEGLINVDALPGIREEIVIETNEAPVVEKE